MTAKASLPSRIIAILLGILAAVTLTCSLCACTASATPESAAKSALSDYLAKIQKGDMVDQLDSIKTQFGSQVSDAATSDPAAALEMVNVWVEGFSYELGDVMMDGETNCAIETTITCHQLAPAITSGIGKAFGNALTQAFSGNVDQDAIKQQTEQILLDEIGATELTSTTISVPMESVNGAWQPTEAGKQDIITAMTGDLEGMASQLSQFLTQQNQ